MKKLITYLNEILIRNATVLTAARGTLENTDILIQNGKIARIGKNLKAVGERADH
jgi:dihydroorotase-like cyclic amidohydrolase